MVAFSFSAHILSTTRIDIYLGFIALAAFLAGLRFRLAIIRELTIAGGGGIVLGWLALLIFDRYSSAGEVSPVTVIFDVFGLLGIPLVLALAGALIRDYKISWSALAVLVVGLAPIAYFGLALLVDRLTTTVYLLGLALLVVVFFLLGLLARSLFVAQEARAEFMKPRA